MRSIPLFRAKKAVHLKDKDYCDFLMQKIADARKSVLCSVFLVYVLDPMEPVETGKVKELLNELLYAHWRGLDVRLIIGNANSGMMMFKNSLSLKYLRQKGMPVKMYSHARDAGMHSKYVIIDDELVILGSANWTGGALFRNREDSLAVYSADAAYRLGQEFEKAWQLTEAGMGNDENR